MTHIFLRSRSAGMAPLWQSVVGPGGIPLHCKFSGLNCQTDLTALMGTKGIFPQCKTVLRPHQTRLRGNGPPVTAAVRLAQASGGRRK